MINESRSSVPRASSSHKASMSLRPDQALLMKRYEQYREGAARR